MVPGHPHPTERNHTQKSMSPHKELLEQKDLLDQQIALALKTEAKQALDTVQSLIAEFGFTAKNFFPWRTLARKVEAKYRYPKTGVKLSGRGRTAKSLLFDLAYTTPVVPRLFNVVTLAFARSARSWSQPESPRVQGSSRGPRRKAL